MRLIDYEQGLSQEVETEITIAGQELHALNQVNTTKNVQQRRRKYTETKHTAREAV